VNTEQYNIVISQEFLKSAIVNVNVSGKTEQSWTGLTYLLSGGTNGDSVLTGLTIPVFFEQSYKDIGYYSGFDGAIYQQDINNNFIYSATTGSPYNLFVYNTSETLSQEITYNIDWGDASPIETFVKKYPSYIEHSYPPLTDGKSKIYSVSLSGTAAWGTTVTTKNITVPYSEVSFNNPDGEYYFIMNSGAWSATPISYKWIFTGDSYNSIYAQKSSNYTTVPYFVTGFTTSKVTQLKQYGPYTYVVGAPVYRKETVIGWITTIQDDYTGYTYDNVLYYDFPAGYTLFITGYINPSQPDKVIPIVSGMTEYNMTPVPIVKEEILIGMVNATEIQSNVFIDRGRLSGTESFLRLGEVDNLGDLIKYGYGYFKIIEQ
jgi:hypothetical protein